MQTDEEDTIFSRILRGEIPCHKIHEDEHVLAFLDVGPLSSGHILVIPREAKAFLHQLSDDSAAAIGRALPRIARGLMEATGTNAYNVLQNNGKEAHQEVMHVHFHIIPKHEDGTGLKFEWNPNPLSDGDVMAERIRECIEED